MKSGTGRKEPRALAGETHTHGARKHRDPRRLKHAAPHHTRRLKRTASIDSEPALKNPILLARAQFYEDLVCRLRFKPVRSARFCLDSCVCTAVVGEAAHHLPHQQRDSPMNHRALFSLLLSGVAVLFPLGLLASAPIILPVDDPEALESHRVIWATEPGIRYELMESADLENWTVVAGFPTEAEALAQQHAFELDVAGEPRFFKVRPLDEQAPEIVGRFPDEGDFAVRRFEPLSVELWDATGIAPESISITVGDLGTYFLSDPELAFTDGLLLFDTGGDTALGNFGDTITVSLHVADLLGHATTHVWSFDLEREPLVTSHLFVFGSPEAQRSGQRIGALPMAVLAQRYGGTGPQRMADSGDGWTLELVEADSIVIRYEGETAPAFTPGTHLANLTPASLDEIFYRLILDVSDDPEAGLVTLVTEDVALDALIRSGSVALGAESLLLTTDGDGVIERAVGLDVGLTLPRLGFSLDGAAIGLLTDGYSFHHGPFSYNTGEGTSLASVTAEELHWWLTPSARAAFEINSRGLERFEGTLQGDVRAASVANATFHMHAASFERSVFKLPKSHQPKATVFVGMLGPGAGIRDHRL
jgi:hypothetical protein